MKRFYVTTAIPYANAEPHLGHVFELVGTDVMARAKRLLGYHVYFQTGTDEHGQKMLEAATKAGRAPREYADDIVPRFRDLWRDLDISHDHFIRSTDDAHKAGVVAFWRAVRDAGDIYLGKYEGWYSVSEEAFYLESQAVRRGDDLHSPETGEKLVWRSEESYFFRWSKYGSALERLIAENPDFIAPAFRANEMVNSFLKPGLQDISISRTSITWGIPVPDDPKHVIYVWFDALLNYITGVGYGSDPERFAQWWPCDVHVVGKDILKFHTLLWPAMLMAAGVAVPRRVFGHGFVNLKGSDDEAVKMSKSKGNVVDPRDLLAHFGGNPDPLRYFLMREMDFGQDGLYSDAALAGRYNSDLVNGIGNLVARTLTMVEKYREGRIEPPGATDPADDAVRDALLAPFADYETLVDDGKFNELLRRIWEGVAALNTYITEQKPFSLAKDPAQAERLSPVLYTLCEGLRVIAVQVYPFIPRTAMKIWEQLGIGEPLVGTPFDRLSQWGFLRATRIRRGENLFPRIDR
jgi:methionyl-tRNA synthetase